MLKQLTIRNYALIESLEVDWDHGFVTITGETGAGKSIILGALQMLLGGRADLKSLRNPDKKAVFEAEFTLESDRLKPLFDQADLDFEKETILRREISPSGKSRAFINDTPVALADLKPIGQALVDVHSQHQNLGLTQVDFQLELLDAFCNHPNTLDQYSKAYSGWIQAQKNLQKTQEAWADWKKESDYQTFLFNELEEAKLNEISDLEELESDLAKLENADSILKNLEEVRNLAEADDLGVLENLTSWQKNLEQISGYWKEIQPLLDRTESARLELEDIASELHALAGKVEANPEELDRLTGVLNQVNGLMAKHGAGNLNELKEIHAGLASKVLDANGLEEALDQNRVEEERARVYLEEKGKELRKSREAKLPALKESLLSLLRKLGLEQADIQILLEPQNPGPSGSDKIEFRFSANKGMPPGLLKETASGGELSRIMLAFKWILAKSRELPTLIFDEIDTGVSGEVALQMAGMMQELGVNTQVICITHLPGIAAKGKTQYKVEKSHEGAQTQTNIFQLNHDQRIRELAEMIEGKKAGDLALQSARALMQED